LPAELLPVADIAQVNLDNRQGNGGDGISDGDTGVSESGRIDDDAGKILLGGIMEPVNNYAFVIALPADRIKFKSFRSGTDFMVDIGEAFGAVNFRFALAQQVEVGAVDDKYFHDSLLY